MATHTAVSTPTVLFFFLFLLVAAAPQAESSVTCGAVAGNLGPCIAYVKGAAPAPSAACCGGIRTLNGMAMTTLDRRTACNCIKNTIARIPGFNPSLASSLPGKCGVSVPYPISPSVNCNAIS